MHGQVLCIGDKKGLKITGDLKIGGYKGTKELAWPEIISDVSGIRDPVIDETAYQLSYQFI